MMIYGNINLMKSLRNQTQGEDTSEDPISFMVDEIIEEMQDEDNIEYIKDNYGYYIYGVLVLGLLGLFWILFILLF